MALAVRLVTLVDIEETDARRMSLSARHQAVLDDGRRVLLLAGRGWTESLAGAGANDVTDILALTSAHDIAETARVVVGPDEPSAKRSQDDMENVHWNTLADHLRAQRVSVEPGELKQLPHDVVLSERLLARLGRGSGDTA
jgi:hypothetical protein